jgi:amyloid beta precursor protein binding protein 1
VVESHPESIYDLRLDKPWKKLADTINLYDFSNLTSHTASHIPFPIILLETIKHWKLAHSTLPVSRQEKHEFQSLIKFKMENSVDDENVREAISYCYKLFAGTHVIF